MNENNTLNTNTGETKQNAFEELTRRELERTQGGWSWRPVSSSGYSNPYAWSWQKVRPAEF